MDQVFLYIGNSANDFFRLIGAYGLVVENPYFLGVGLVVGPILGLLKIK